MANELRAELGSLELKATASLATRLAAETWQFWAFVFGAAVTLGFALIDEIKLPWPLSYRIALKSGVFMVLALLTYCLLWWLRGSALQKLTIDTRCP